MPDIFTPEQRHHVMSQIHSSSTKPELHLRYALWRLGFRYRINDKRLPGSPDIVLPRYRTVVFVHGCFWHGHKGCKNYTERDQEVWRKLEAKGWSVIIVWECELEKSRLDETVFNVAKEIKENGKLFNQRKEERRAERERYRHERAEKATKIHTLERILPHSQ